MKNSIEKFGITETIVSILIVVIAILFTCNVLDLVEVENKINLLGFLSFLSTLVIAVLIPFVIKKTIDDKRGIKAYLLSQLDCLLEIVKENHEIFSSIYSEARVVRGEDIEKVLGNFYDAELKIDSLRKQMEISYPRHISLVNLIKDGMFRYKQYLTDDSQVFVSGASLSPENFRIDKNEFAKFDRIISIVIHKLHSL